MSYNRMTHLLPADAALFAQFLEAHPGRYHRIEFDVRVGSGRDPGPGFDRNIRNMAIHLSQRRIDAIGFSPGRIDIIEVTVQAGIKALGQLIAYPALYKMSFFPPSPVHPVLVTRTFSSDAEHLFRQHDIEVHVLPNISNFLPG